MSKKKKQRNSNKSTSQLANKPNKYQRKQQRYLEKKNAQKVNQIPKTLSPTDLEILKEEQMALISEANHRIEMIKMQGYTSRAIDRIEHETGKDYFDLDSIETREDLIREVTRVRVFLNDDGSTLTGAKLETAQIYSEQYRGKFGNEYNNEENKFARFDVNVIDKDVAARAFEAYRKIESHRASQIANEGGYGSENLIIALYDAEIRGLDSLVYGEELLDAYVLKESVEWDNVKRDSPFIVPINGKFDDNITGRFLF